MESRGTAAHESVQTTVGAALLERPWAAPGGAWPAREEEDGDEPHIQRGLD